MSRTARLGAFILLTLAVLVAGVFIVGSKQYLFHSTYRLSAYFDNVAGLGSGADVQVGGVHSGTVEDIELPNRPSGRVRVVMVLDSSTHEIIKQDSVASIQTEGLLGNQFVAISFGSPGQPNVKNDGTIRSEPPLLMADMLKKANGILDGALQTVQNTTLATAHLSAITGKINDGQGTIGELINNKQIYNNLQQSTSSMQSTMANAQVGVTDFQENMEALKHNFLLNGFFKKRGYEDASQLAADRVSALPQGAPAKEFDFTAKQLFDGHDSAKLKDKKTLKELGDYLAHNPFGFAVVVDSTDMEGDSHKDQVLTEARAMVVREYLVENFGFNDSLLKTMGIGKQAVGANSSDWGAIKVLVYPAGTPVPQAASQAQPATKP